MIALRLVRLIEKHSEELAAEILHKLRSSPRTPGMNKVPREELHQRTSELLQELGSWLLTKSEADIRECYLAIGELRHRQGVPLTDFCWAITLTKEHIWNFLQREGFLFNSVELYGQLELLSRLDQFFEHALCYATEGYERQARPPAHARATAQRASAST